MGLDLDTLIWRLHQLGAPKALSLARCIVYDMRAKHTIWISKGLERLCFSCHPLCLWFHPCHVRPSSWQLSWYTSLPICHLSRRPFSLMGCGERSLELPYHILHFFTDTSPQYKPHSDNGYFGSASFFGRWRFGNGRTKVTIKS